MKIRYYFVILLWTLFNHKKARVFWDWHLKGMADYYAYKKAKEKQK